MGSVVSASGHAPAPPTPVLDPSADALERLSDVDVADPKALLDCLADISAQMQQAANIWQAYAENPVQLDDQYTAVMWIGADKSRDLHRIRLKLRDLARQLSASSGVSFHDTIGFSSQLDIVDAYGQLMPDETGASRAKDAIETIDKRRSAIEDAMAMLG